MNIGFTIGLVCSVMMSFLTLDLCLSGGDQQDKLKMELTETQTRLSNTENALDRLTADKLYAEWLQKLPTPPNQEAADDFRVMFEAKAAFMRMRAGDFVKIEANMMAPDHHDRGFLMYLDKTQTKQRVVWQGRSGHFKFSEPETIK